MTENKKLEDAAKEHIDAKMGGSKYRLESPNDAYMTARMQSFKDGATWKTEQVTNDAIEMLQWLVEQDNAIFLYEGTIQHKASAKELSKELYELWQQSKKK